MLSSTEGAPAQVIAWPSTLAAMKSRRRWLLHFNKRPHYANGLPRSGPLDSIEDVSQFVSFDEAVATCDRLGSGWVLGFALGWDERGYWHGIDYDKVDQNGLVELVNATPGYLEYSLSAKGAHAIGFGVEFPALGSNRSGIEAYCRGRYFVFTGNTLRDAELTDLSPFIGEKLVSLRATASADTPHAGASFADPLITDLRSALCYIDPDERGEWVAGGHALKALDEAGYELFAEWSRRSAKHRSEADRKTWDSFKPNRTGPAAIFAKAQAAGWKNPGRWAHGPSLDPASLANAQAMFGRQSRYKLLSGADIDAMPDPEYLVEDLILRRSINVVYGRSTNGKSFLVTDLGLAVARGEDWFGLAIEQAPVVYVTLEGRSGFKLRKQAWQNIKGLDWPSNFHTIYQDFDFRDAEAVADLIAVVPKGALLIIDTLARAGDDAENDGEQRSLIIRRAIELQAAIEGVLMLVAHPGKDADKGIRGHQNLFDTLDCVLVVNRNGENRSWKADKVKDGDDSIGRNFSLPVIQLGINKRGKPITSCIVAPAHGAFDNSALLSEAENKALNGFIDAAVKSGQLDDDGNFVGLLLEDWRKAFNNSLSDETKPEAKRQAFHRARKALETSGRLAVVDDVCRIVGDKAGIHNGLIVARIKAVTA